MKIVVLDGYLVGVGGLDWSPVERLGEMAYYDLTTRDEDVAAKIGDAQAVLSNRCPISAQVIDRCPNLKIIHSLGTGFNQIDLEAAARRGITVTNTPGYGTGAVAQMTIALLMEIVRRVGEFDRLCKGRGWTQSIDPDVCAIPQMELTGKTMGIVGLGDIGHAVARVAMAMDMEVLALRRHPKAALECEHLHFTDLDTLLRRSDVVSVHCPLNDQTRGMIGREELAAMKPGAILLNTARGPIVDKQALLQALDSGHLYAYGADVSFPEPFGKDDPLACHPRCVITPHVAWMPAQTRQRVIDMAGQTLEAFLAGTPKHVVSAPQ